MEKRFVKISYTGQIKDGKVFDTTDKETAVKEGVFDEKRIYKPVPVILGEMQVIKGIDEAASGMKVGESKDIEIAPEKAYGQRNPGLVRLVPLKAFREQKLTPYPGMRIELDGQMAKIQTISGGRVRVDFNSDLAGKTLLYKLKVEAEAKKPEDKIGYLIERSFNSSEGFGVKLLSGKLEVELPEPAYRDRSILVRKASLVSEVFRYTDNETISFLETWNKKKPEEKKANKAAEAPKKK